MCSAKFIFFPSLFYSFIPLIGFNIWVGLWCHKQDDEVIIGNYKVGCW